MIREWCSCGAAFHSRSIRRVIEWRTTHHHDGKLDPEPDMQGSHAQVETAYPDRHEADEHRPSIRLGFQANPEYSARSIELAHKLRTKALKNLGRDE